MGTKRGGSETVYTLSCEGRNAFSRSVEGNQKKKGKRDNKPDPWPNRRGMDWAKTVRIDVWAPKGHPGSCVSPLGCDQGIIRSQDLIVWKDDGGVRESGFMDPATTMSRATQIQEGRRNRIRTIFGLFFFTFVTNRRCNPMIKIFGSSDYVPLEYVAFFVKTEFPQ